MQYFHTPSKCSDFSTQFRPTVYSSIRPIIYRVSKESTMVAPRAALPKMLVEWPRRETGFSSFWPQAYLTYICHANCIICQKHISHQHTIWYHHIIWSAYSYILDIPRVGRSFGGRTFAISGDIQVPGTVSRHQSMTCHFLSVCLPNVWRLTWWASAHVMLNIFTNWPHYYYYYYYMIMCSVHYNLQSKYGE